VPDLKNLLILFEGHNFSRLLDGLGVTIKLSLISIAFSTVLGILFGLFMVIKNPVTKAISRFYLECIRMLPQLVLLFLAYFGLTRAFRINLSGETAAVLVFVIWGTAEMGDLVRSAIISIPKYQYNSAYALGLTKKQTYLYIILPQITNRLIPPAINLMTRMIKTTTLVIFIGVTELLKVGQQIIEANRYTAPQAAIWIYLVIFFMYFITCYPISLLAKVLEKKMKY
jgi:polar amino acid transport system permease protein